MALAHIDPTEMGRPDPGLQAVPGAESTIGTTPDAMPGLHAVEAPAKPVFPNPLEDSFSDVPLETPDTYVSEELMLDAKKVAKRLVDAEEEIASLEAKLAKERAIRDAFEQHARQITSMPGAEALPVELHDSLTNRSARKPPGQQR